MKNQNLERLGTKTGSPMLVRRGTMPSCCSKFSFCSRCTTCRTTRPNFRSSTGTPSGVFSVCTSARKSRSHHDLAFSGRPRQGRHRGGVVCDLRRTPPGQRFHGHEGADCRRQYRERAQATQPPGRKRQDKSGRNPGRLAGEQATTKRRGRAMAQEKR